MVSFLTLLACAMAYLTIRIKRLVWKDDKILPLIFAFMTASLVMYTFYYMSAVATEYKLDWFLSGKRSLTCTNTYLPYSAMLLLAVGVLLNLHKWI